MLRQWHWWRGRSRKSHISRDLCNWEISDFGLESLFLCLGEYIEVEVLGESWHYKITFWWVVTTKKITQTHQNQYLLREIFELPDWYNDFKGVKPEIKAFVGLAVARLFCFWRILFGFWENRLWDFTPGGRKIYPLLWDFTTPYETLEMRG